MDKNSVIGFVLIGLILVGFTFFQSKQAREAARIQRQLDSAAAVEAVARYKADSLRQAEAIEKAAREGAPAQEVEAAPVERIYQDAALENSTRKASSLHSPEIAADIHSDITLRDSVLGEVEGCKRLSGLECRSLLNKSGCRLLFVGADCYGVCGIRHKCICSEHD